MPIQNVTPIINPAAGSPVVKIDADTTDADLKLDDLKARIDATSAMIRVGLDPADADARIQALQARLAGLAANTPVVTFPTLGLVVHGGDSILIGHVANQVASNTYGTLATTTTYLGVDFDVIEVPTPMLGKLA